MEIKLKNISKVYLDADKEIEIIKDLNYTFLSKKSYAIIGSSGVGKSTLLHILAGLDAPTSGEVVYGDTILSQMNTDEKARFRRLHIGFIFQGHHLLPEFTALENVMMPLIIRGENDKKSSDRGVLLLERVGLKDRLKHLPSQLSGGEQQRVAIARSLATNPAILLADEPTGSLDSATGGEVRNLLIELQRENQNTLIVVTHNLELAKSLDFTLEMKPKGRLEIL